MPRLSPGNFAPCSGLQKSTKPYARKQSTPCLARFLPAVKTAPVWRGRKVTRNRGHPAAQPHSTKQRRGAAGSRRGSRMAAKEDTQRDPRSQYNGRMDKGQPAQAHHEYASCCVLSFIPFHGQRRTPQPRSVRLCVGERGYPIPGHGVGTTPPGEKCGARKARRFFA